jgi:hypothetical protein
MDRGPKKKRNPLGLRKLPPKEEDGGVVVGTSEQARNSPILKKKKKHCKRFLCAAPFAVQRSAQVLNCYMDPPD